MAEVVIVILCFLALFMSLVLFGSNGTSAGNTGH